METRESVLALMFSLDSVQRKRLREDRMDLTPHGSGLHVPLS